MAHGEVFRVSDTHFIWMIHDFSRFATNDDTYFFSPDFAFKEHKWFLQTFGHRRESDHLVRFRINRRKKPHGSKRCALTYRMCIRDLMGDGPYWTSHVATEEFYSKNICGTMLEFLEPDIVGNRSRIAPGDVLHLHLTFDASIKTAPPIGEGVVDPAYSVFSSRSRKVGTEARPGSQAKPSSSSRSRGADSTDANLISFAPDEGSTLTPKPGRSTSSEGVDKLLENLKDFWLDGHKADVTLIVKGTEFKAHKAFLMARSPEFKRMFDGDVSGGTLEIPDCEPEDFRTFLLYLYTGRVEKPTVKTVAELYCLSARYSILALRSYCFRFLVSNLNVDSFCGILWLGLHQGDAELTASANAFFAKNMKEIVNTDKWKSFIKLKPAEAHEVLIKALSEDEALL